MKHIYKLILVSALFLVASCSKEKEEVVEPVIEPVVEVTETIVEEVIEEKKPLVYSVQIGAYTNYNATLERNTPDVTIAIEDGLTKYRLGKFSTYQEAANFKRNLSQYSDAFIVATDNDVRIGIGEALLLSNED